MAELERLLQGGRQVQTLLLAVLNYNTATKDHSAWIKVNTEKVYILKVLRIINMCTADLIEHLTFKYPKLEKLNLEKIDVLCLSGAATTDAFKINMDRILDLTKLVSNKNVSV